VFKIVGTAEIAKVNIPMLLKIDFRSLARVAPIGAGSVSR